MVKRSLPIARGASIVDSDTISGKGCFAPWIGRWLRECEGCPEDDECNESNVKAVCSHGGPFQSLQVVVFLAHRSGNHNFWLLQLNGKLRCFVVVFGFEIQTFTNQLTRTVIAKHYRRLSYSLLKVACPALKKEDLDEPSAISQWGYPHRSKS